MTTLLDWMEESRTPPAPRAPDVFLRLARSTADDLDMSQDNGLLLLRLATADAEVEHLVAQLWRVSWRHSLLDDLKRTLRLWLDDVGEREEGRQTLDAIVDELGGTGKAFQLLQWLDEWEGDQAAPRDLIRHYRQRLTGRTRAALFRVRVWRILAGELTQDWNNLKKRYGASFSRNGVNNEARIARERRMSVLTPQSTGLPRLASTARRLAHALLARGRYGAGGPSPRLLMPSPCPATTHAWTTRHLNNLTGGIADSLAATKLCELGLGRSVVLMPRVNAAHVRHPAWASSVAVLRSQAQVSIVETAAHEPGEPAAPLPWDGVLDVLDRHR